MTRRYLFVDLDDVETVHNVVQRVVEATKHPGNPVLPLGELGAWDSLQARPWEGRSVLYDAEERLFTCWYAGSDLSNDRWWALGYAVSEDGIHWEKPSLGLFEYNGHTDNNICCLDFGPVIKDEAEPDPRRRYKMLAKGAAGASGVAERRAGPEGLRQRAGGPNVVRIYHSEDGRHWYEHTVRSAKWGDLVALVHDDQGPDVQRRYKLVWQERTRAIKAGPEQVRTKWMACGPDLEHLSMDGVPHPPTAMCGKGSRTRPGAPLDGRHAAPDPQPERRCRAREPLSGAAALRGGVRDALRARLGHASRIPPAHGTA